MSKLIIPDYEERIIGAEVECREDGGEPVIEGHAAVFNKLSEDLGGFREKIAPGAFRDAIATDDVRALLNHDSNFVLGRNRAGTLQLEEDEVGLRVKIFPPSTTWAKDLLLSIRRKDISQMSFGFRTQKQEWDRTNPQAVVRTLLSVKLFDVSPVTYPAYPQTDVAVRSFNEFLESVAREESDKLGLGVGLAARRLRQVSSRP